MARDIFGASSMGYAVIESERMDRWRALLKAGIGLHEAQADSEVLAYRMDEHQRRIIVKRGATEDLVAVGWQLRDRSTLDEVLQRLKKLGIVATKGSPHQAAERGVREFWRVIGPKRLAIELFTEPLTDDRPLEMLSPGFITGEMGMGHLAITSRKPEQMRRFWQEVFDARHSDHIVERIAGVTLDIDFFRVNPRHHSIAIAVVKDLPMDPIRTRVQHMNLLTTSVSGLTDAFLRCRKLGFEMAHEIGEHPNDREQSFYVMTPSGFEMELGWNALEVVEETWLTTSYKGISLWGHKPEKQTRWKKLTTNLGNFGRGIRSLFNTEFSPL
ncbi:VOC family protein [Pseudomonas sp. GD04087]|uniref:VOC family protein n=1 Tax=unclassified Pseudomonas TaxID=196821 RepID=UPI0024473CC6|nr:MULTISPECIES: VOC family protein [unclassified Pseudomonas]MDH0289476.1 VOC family protein [Pseudomonas sp. GD04087]MDH1051028.1 VOC family protein [Pseudomonas sp. GD03903]MDH1999297.1 VOC family protein [Pseudomonas sp. GD03691]